MTEDTGFRAAQAAYDNAEPRESRSHWRVRYDTGHDCGSLPPSFDSAEEAEGYGLDWQTDMVAATPGATEEDYSYEVVEIECEEEDDHDDR